ncbi:MAG: hypothetical protein COS76_00215 [Candidatus Portnoybacteria bacterium CG06_land_8_20_14_3_00_39_12]|uniref:Uncharacterized protein n=3 Tax=Candidatus Portnoyibacteriota TaxID=1817913 RepID=A0A2M8KH46_9BACT|nr:MAG: hypothetical protein AUJ33_01000 [Parcubacteria group bacterium CG1_02_40_25]PIU75545.1 MAG: hypothetical protein COS76_00215 [Candidatus Portnoybacteria bacterium CG06_land_8_20_14_3_00_39_12]PIZ70825.1 MAG: hypothetical protein COY09_02000 [Candidatus Portnoybacteria bacterium CG_4_10_14_0_2_um_filter_39_11]PJE59235.1 MAG: hypothetical protein COU83_00090 [Candidatus Portnoybacteria bacterium CG10_big_fil_rev_8_21_14_0_10_40_22]
MDTLEKKSHDGFSIIELIIYLAIFSLLALALSSVFWQVLQNNNRQLAITELMANANLISHQIELNVKNAQSINQPASPGQTANQLSLAMADSSINPTIFNLQDQKINLSQGANPSQPLTSDRIRVVNFTTTNLTSSATSTLGIIKLSIDLESNNPASSIFRPTTFSFTMSISLRQ